MLTKFAVAAVTAGVLMSASPFSSAHAQDSLSDAQKAQIENMIRDYVLQNPEIVRDALISLERQQIAQQAEQQKQILSARNDEIYNSASDFVAGNPQGDVTLVEFFDYNCGYCRKALPDLNALLETDPNLRVVLKEFPILGPGSLEAARLAVAAIGQGKYLDYHRALLSSRGQVDKARALEVAKEIGLDVARLEEDAKAAEINQTLRGTHNLSTALNINGTPSYVLGDEIIPGAIGVDELKSKIAALREKQAKQSN